jgi:PhnB protein
MSIVPHLTIPGGKAVEAAAFYTELFGAKETRRFVGQDGKRLMHCELEFSGGVLYLADEFRDDADAKPALNAVFVGFPKPSDVDAHAAKAKNMGATMTLEAADMFWGDRFAMFTDPFGHSWQLGAALAK